MDTKVEIREVPREKWHGKTGEEDFSRPITIVAGVDAIRGVYTPEFTSDDRRLELQRKTGYDLSLQFSAERPHPFWDSQHGKVRLEKGINFLDPANELEEIKLAVLRGSSLCANTEADIHNGNCPDALFYIYDAEQEATAGHAKIQLTQDAYVALSKMTMKDKANVLKVMTGLNVRGKAAGFIDVQISNLVQSEPTEFLKYAKQTSEENECAAIVLQAIDNGVFRRDGDYIFWGDTRIGYDIPDAVSFMLDPKNASSRSRVEEKIGFAKELKSNPYAEEKSQKGLASDTIKATVNDRVDKEVFDEELDEEEVKDEQVQRETTNRRRTPTSRSTTRE